MHTFISRDLLWPVGVCWKQWRVVAQLLLTSLNSSKEIASKDDTFWCDLSNIDTISTAIEKALRLDDTKRVKWISST